MPRYWIIAPTNFEKPERFNKTWQFDLSNNVISIGWEELGDISNMSLEVLTQKVAETYPEKPPQTKSLVVNMLWDFYHEINPDDIIIARKGRKILAAIGRVTRAGYYSPNKNSQISHPHFLDVEWQNQPRDKVYPIVVFPMHTLSEANEVKYRNLVEGTGIPSLITPTSETLEDPSAFVLEKYLEDFIVTNFKSIFKDKLTIYEDDEGAKGQQYDTEIGPIDILAVERETNSFVILELKKGQPSDKVVGQILRYMGWVKQNLCKPDQVVKGLVICREQDSKMIYALSMTKNIDIKYYSVSFTLKETP